MLALLACGLTEVAARSTGEPTTTSKFRPPAACCRGFGRHGRHWCLVWVALKVGALSYGGGFVIVPLMQAEAVNHYHWMTSGQFLSAVALGQITPGPVLQTVAVVGYAAAGLVVAYWWPCRFCALVSLHPFRRSALRPAAQKRRGPELPDRRRANGGRRHRRRGHPARGRHRPCLASCRLGRGGGVDLRAAPQCGHRPAGRRSYRPHRGAGGPSCWLVMLQSRREASANLMLQ